MLPEIKYNQTISAVEWGIQKNIFYIRFPCSVLYEIFVDNRSFLQMLILLHRNLFLLEGGGGVGDCFIHV